MALLICAWEHTPFWRGISAGPIYSHWRHPGCSVPWFHSNRALLYLHRNGLEWNGKAHPLLQGALLSAGLFVGERISLEFSAYSAADSGSHGGLSLRSHGGLSLRSHGGLGLGKRQRTQQRSFLSRGGIAMADLSALQRRIVVGQIQAVQSILIDLHPARTRRRIPARPGRAFQDSSEVPFWIQSAM